MDISIKLRRNMIFAASLCFFVIPPLFAGAASARVFSAWTFPLKPLLYALFAFVLVRFSFPPSSPIKGDAFRFVRTGWTLATFGALCVIASVIEIIVRLSGGKESLEPAIPSSIAETFFCIVNFACASFYEEALYRLYLPESIRAVLEDLLPKRINKSEHENTLQEKNAVNEHGSRNIFLISEISAVSFFALSHRYLGLPAVANAFFAGIVLRICCKKSKTLWTNTAAHFAYNMLSLILFALIR
ncbi:CPBP family intramembrane glutamic endopeptidase [Treponema sp. Marseille-Q4132]|uniref:CPBP family intramembrane glutamic endopeptidase n=1 Tax=Treponema sp. Marseille-Q4132 TaxID=2766701 RepID=UPI001653177E|nr:CPBP family intramembrane glutamic endopeptidase [Treponema sp. Marseille-Q4132]QNL97416.1 CPBP family intramembrane metalloprotease [Treponema sp. Marseille-Q4132]